MSRIFACTNSLARQLNSPQLEWDESLPRRFEITKERFKRAQEVEPLVKDGDTAGAKAKAGVEGVAEEGGAIQGGKVAV